MKLKKILTSVLIGTLVLGNGAVVYADGEDEVTLTFWHTYSDGTEQDCMNAAIAGFEEANPGIKVEAIEMPVNELDQEIIAAVAGGAAPDVMALDLVSVAQYAELGALEEVSGYEGFDELKDNFLDNTLDTSYYDGGYYGLALHRSVATPVWNMDLLEEFGISEIPTTIDELVELAKEVNDPENEKYLFTIEGTYTWGMLPWFWSLGGSLTDDEYTVASGYLNSDASVSALDTIAGWYNDGVISGSIIGEQPEAWGGMIDGKYGMTATGPWFYSSTDTEYETETTVMPSGDGGSISVIGGQDIIMFKNSENKDAAWKFMQYMVSDEVQVSYIDAGLLPPTKTAREGVDTSDKPWLEGFLDQLETAKPRTPSPEWGNMEDILSTAFEQVVRGEATAKEVLDDAAAQIDELLK